MNPLQRPKTTIGLLRQPTLETYLIEAHRQRLMSYAMISFYDSVYTCQGIDIERKVISPKNGHKRPSLERHLGSLNGGNQPSITERTKAITAV
jgi:hypothetical protein